MAPACTMIWEAMPFSQGMAPAAPFSHVYGLAQA